MSRATHRPSRQAPSTGSQILSTVIDTIFQISGIDYWAKIPTDGQRFSFVKHFKRTCQLAGFLAMGAFATYSFSNWLQWYQYNISNRWDFFGSYFHTVIIAGVALLSSIYFTSGTTAKAYHEIQQQHEYLSYKYLGASYDI